MNISGNRSGEKRKGKCIRKQRRKKKSYGAREVSASLEQMVSVGTDLASIARSYKNDVMSVGDCVKELLSSGHVQTGDEIHLFALWFLREKDNRKSYAAAETPYLRFKFVEYCFERDKQSRPRDV
ncbi:unnamed protein product [Fraxinus pennsylvanica]|uniref:Uncharacterized protein n=1 Tax=Fraxinus pennsylvanica TaxID=56036 RepID=A0AAD2E7L1_9LAMI|nr:unnamed protein product [Fraxinus pennsylvanica]